MSRGYLVSLREQDFNSVGGQPLHHDSLLVASEEAAATRHQLFMVTAPLQLPVSPEVVTLMTACKVLRVWDFLV